MTEAIRDHFWRSHVDEDCQVVFCARCAQIADSDDCSDDCPGFVRFTKEGDAVVSWYEADHLTTDAVDHHGTQR